MAFARRVPFIPQMEIVECGAAALAMILAYHGHHAPLPEVRQACGVSRNGSSALDIVRAARSFGLDAEGVTLEMHGLSDLPLPAILHWGFQHFVILERLRARDAVLLDPARGRSTVPRAEIERRFTGVAIVFSPNETFERRAPVQPNYRRYRGIFRQALPTYIELLLASILVQTIGLLPPVMTQLLLDRVVVPRQSEWLLWLAIALGIAALLSSAVTFVRSWTLQNLQRAVDLHLLTSFIRHIVHLPRTFFLQRSPGDLFQRTQSNSAMSDLVTTRSVSALLDVFLIIGYIGLLFLYNVPVGIVIISLAVTRILLLLFLRSRSREIMTAELAAAGSENAALVEALSTIETTKAAAAQSHVVRRWFGRMATQTNLSARRQTFDAFSSLAMMMVQGFGAAAALWISGSFVIAGRMTIGVFTAIASLQAMFMAPLERLLSAATQVQYLGIHMRRLEDVFESAPEPAGGADPGPISGAIEIRDVTFRYVPDGPDVLANVSIGIEAGEKVALIGPMGAGKSTLAALLIGLHVPNTGTISYDGLELENIDRARLRSRIGVVLQETFFFDDTIRRNLTLDDSDWSEEMLHEAAAAACIDHVIDALPHRYDTLMGPNGTRFSGGERQRFALARALVREPSILLLDEATRALDLETEKRIHANLALLRCTRIVITHRFATIEDSDRILVLDGGGIVQSGDFSTLARQDGLFRQLLRNDAERT